MEDEQGGTVYHLRGIVIHIGQGLSYGHYQALVKSQGKWIKFDDTNVSVVDDKFMKALYGTTQSDNFSWPSAYMLLYESEDLL
jgi:ubiquitin C-terminal hydrolase